MLEVFRGRLAEHRETSFGYLLVRKCERPGNIAKVNQQSTANWGNTLENAQSKPPAQAPPTHFQKHWLALITVFFIAFAARLLSYHDIRKCPVFDSYLVLADARYYDQRASSIVGGDFWGDEVFFMAPMYEYFLAVPYASYNYFFPDTTSRPADHISRFDWAIYSQCVLGALTCCILFCLAKYLFGNPAGWIAGLTAALYGPFIFFDGLLMPTTLVLFLDVVMLATLIHADRGDHWRGWVMSGAATGLAAVAHGTALLVAPMTLVAIVGRSWGCLGKRTLGNLFAFSAGVVLIVSPVSVRNYVVAKDFVLLTSNAGMNFFIGNNATANGTHIIYKYPYRLAALRDYSQGAKRGPEDPPPSKVSRAIGTQALEWIKANPKEAIALWARKFDMFFNHVELGRYDHHPFYRQYAWVLRRPLASFGLVAPLGLAGAICLFQRRRELKFVYLILAAQVFAVVMMFVLGRYRFPAVACFILLAAGQITWMIDRIRSSQYRKAAASLGLLIFFFLGVHHKIEGFDDQYGMARNYAKLGKALDRKGLPDDAILAYDQAIELPWTDGKELVLRYQCLRRVGDLHMTKGHFEQAIDYWETAQWEIGNDIEAQKRKEHHDQIMPLRISLTGLKDMESHIRASLKSAYRAKEKRGRTD